MSRYAKDDYYNHEGYKDITAHEAIKNIERDKKMKIRISFKDKSELDKVLDILKTNFKIIKISKIYKNTRKDTDASRIYVDLENK